jgi:hypothetical protein
VNEVKIEKTEVTKIKITGVDRLDPVSVYVEDIGPGQGKITIECYCESWSYYWGGMGKDRKLPEFFCSCNNDYIIDKLTDIEKRIYSIDKLREDAKEKGIDIWRDDPWNDYDFMQEMYGPDMYEWSGKIPKEINYKWEYLSRIIDAVKDAFEMEAQK